jgi:hypothetical protein
MQNFKRHLHNSYECGVTTMFFYNPQKNLQKSCIIFKPLRHNSIIHGIGVTATSELQLSSCLYHSQQKIKKHTAMAISSDTIFEKKLHKNELPIPIADKEAKGNECKTQYNLISLLLPYGMKMFTQENLELHSQMYQQQYSQVNVTIRS